MTDLTNRRPTKKPRRRPIGRVSSKLSPRFIGDLLAVALLWSLVIVCFWHIALAGRVLAGGDIFTYFYPYWAEATRAIRAGRVPLWNPYLFMGAPFLANSQVGFLYPLNWPLWLTLPAHRSVHLTIVLHLCLAALNSYTWGRVSLKLGRVGAWTLGAIFALGGYLGAQVEHINQLQGLAWLPLILTLYDRSWLSNHRARTSKPGMGFAGLVIVIGLVLLAGHTQTAFISLVALGIYGLVPGIWQGLYRQKWHSLIQRAALLIAGAAMGGALAAVQLLPTWELSRFSIRAGGLPFNERLSFSLSPLYLARALLPGFTGAVSLDHIEHIAYVGIVGLALVVLAIQHAKTLSFFPLGPSLLLLCFGLFFSLGLYNPLYVLLVRFVPGFAHFRVPARWLTLFVLGAAALAGWAADGLYRRRWYIGWRAAALTTGALILMVGWAVGSAYVAGEAPIGRGTLIGWGMGLALTMGLLLIAARAPRGATVGLLILLTVELLAAGNGLPHSRATAPQAFTSLRPAVAHLLAAGAEGSGAPARFISMSDITFDPGDLSDIELIYGPQLAPDALYDYIVAAKQKEVLSPNISLAFAIPAVDGYDGGVLPLARYVMLQRLFRPGEEVSMDGRLRENLTIIPDGRWLSLFNVRHVITDKLRDAWLDGVFYDLQFGARLARGERVAVAHVPRFDATALGVVSHLQGGADLLDGTLVGEVVVSFGDGITRTFELRAGRHTAEGTYSPDVAHAPAQVGAHFSLAVPGETEEKRLQGDDYVTRLAWGEAAPPTEIVVRATLPRGKLVVRGLSLIDERTDSFQALVLSDRGHFRLAHSGDVKIYENLEVLPRAFFIPEDEIEVAEDDDEALAIMRDEEFDPSRTLVLNVNDGVVPRPIARSMTTVGTQQVRVVRYAPERVEIMVHVQEAGYLVLTDAWYPDWEATVDGESVTIHRADLIFRAVAVDAGRHRVIFSCHSVSLIAGVVISFGTMASLGVVGLWRFVQR